jgi:hypothetical protein
LADAIAEADEAHREADAAADAELAEARADEAAAEHAKPPADDLEPMRFESLGER